MTEPTVLPTDAKARKETPLARCLFDYFPAALAEVARVSFQGNKQHNGDNEPFWAYDKSMDEADCLLRHFAERGTLDSDGLPHSAKVAWRALALLQRELTDSGRAPMPRGARLTGPSRGPCASKSGAATRCRATVRSIWARLFRAGWGCGAGRRSSAFQRAWLTDEP